MIPLIKLWARKILYDKSAAKHVMRRVLTGVAGGGLAFEQSITDAVQSPRAVQIVKLVIASLLLINAMTPPRRGQSLDEKS